MTTECNMAGALMEAWREFSISPQQFQQIAADFAVTLEDGLCGRPSPLQMLPGFVGRPCGEETGRYLALDFGGTNVRVAVVELCGGGRTRIEKLHKVSLRDQAAGYDYTAANVQLGELFDFIARQVALVADGGEQLLGHSFSYGGKQTAIGRADFIGWTKEIKVSGIAGQDINATLAAALARQTLAAVRPVAVLNDTVATLLTAAYAMPAADMGSVCGTGQNSCYYEKQPRHGDRSREMAYNAESGGFDRLPFSRFDNELDAASEIPGRQRMEKMVAGRYLGELARRILWEGRGECGMQFVERYPVFAQIDGLTSQDLAVFAGDDSKTLSTIEAWLSQHCPFSGDSLAERHFIKAVAELVIERSATLVAASYAGFLLRLDPAKKQSHLIGVNGSLYEKMPGFAATISRQLEQCGGWPTGQVEFLVVDEAPLRGAAIAAAMAQAEGETA
jgi:hexokinase